MFQDIYRGKDMNDREAVKEVLAIANLAIENLAFHVERSRGLDNLLAIYPLERVKRGEVIGFDLRNILIECIHELAVKYGK